MDFFLEKELFPAKLRNGAIFDDQTPQVFAQVYLAFLDDGAPDRFEKKPGLPIGPDPDGLGQAPRQVIAEINPVENRVQVIFGGILIAALRLFDEPGLQKFVVNQSLPRLPLIDQNRNKAVQESTKVRFSFPVHAAESLAVVHQDQETVTGNPHSIFI